MVDTPFSPSVPVTGDSAEPRRRGSRKSAGGITLRDVAQLAGVAPITASRALNTPQAVSPKVLQKVREAVERTGYVPNLLAGGLASNKSRLVAVVVPTVIGPVFQGIVHTLTETLAAAGYQVMLGQSGYENSREDALLEAIIGRRPDGVVLTGIMRSPEARKRLLASGIPVVETWDLTPNPIDMLVGFSHEEIGREVARYLHRLGRRQVAVVGGRDERSQRRMNAFAEQAVALGMGMGAADGVPMHGVIAPTTLGQGRSGLVELLQRQPGIDAIFCSSDLLALGVMIEAQARGIAIPQQLAVVGFGDLDFARDLQPQLTTVRIDGTAIGQRAARFIIDRANDIEIAQPVVDVGFSIISRQSA
ncbi:LacI family DNA-binding transcriptional regulator [Herbaspirillum sp. alder98]|uniref:LacI family DNA-binding transcriptional regulator n=1 Tax=Herbaspirillum sp. alder98 TaxID=2913096 RepID=UPI001CD8911B|nr:LacI family DNA-binding transcriptional regulator [Herbaspirillum sp. alder98]MCA1324909.1 LacI family DNA-binding transcriptional regulator [Herbaspirillum sp. alder98]